MRIETDERQRMEELMTLMNSLPDKQQLILRLRHMEGMTIGEKAGLWLKDCTERIWNLRLQNYWENSFN